MQIEKIATLINNIIKRVENLERKNNSVLIARINKLEQRVNKLENK